MLANYKYAAWIAAVVLAIIVAAIAVPAFYGMIFIWRGGYPYLAEPTLLLWSIVKTIAFALPSATMQTLIGFLSALFVTSNLKGQSPIAYRATLALDIFLLLPYLIPSIAWFWFTVDWQISMINFLPETSGSQVMLENIAEAFDVHLITIAHLAPFTYLVARLFFDRLRSEHVDILERQMGSRLKAILVMGGRPLLGLAWGVFVLRLLITANKFDLPFIGSKGYEQIRPDSLMFTVPLWLYYLLDGRSGLSIAAVLSLSILGIFGLLVGIWIMIRRRVSSGSLDSWIGDLCGVVLTKMKNCQKRFLDLSTAIAFIWMATSAFFVIRNISIDSESLRKLIGNLDVINGLFFSFILIILELVKFLVEMI